MTIRIAEARTQAEREALFAFRYRIYVEEMNRPQKYADHGRRRIEDPLDKSGTNFVAWAGESIVGCVRVNFCRDGGTAYYEELLHMADVGPTFREDSSICTRLMVAPEFRKSRLATHLSCACFQLGRENRIRWNFIDCNDHLVRFFERMGYVKTHDVVHEEYGSVNVMRFDLEGVDRLRSMNSIFVRLAMARSQPLAEGQGKVA